MAALDIATLTSPPPGADNECLADHAAMSPATRRAAFRRRRVRFLGVMAVMLLAAAGLGGLLALNLNKRDAPLPQAETLALLASDPAADPVSADGPAVATRAGQAAPAVTATVEKTLRKEGTPERPDDNSGETAPPASDARVATRPVVEEGQPSRKPPRTRSTPRGEDAPDRTAPRTGAAGDTTTAAGGGTTEGTAKSTTSSVIPADQRMTTVTSRDKPGVTGLDRAVPSLTTPGGDSGQKKPPAGVDSAQKKPPASKLFARAAIESLSAKGSLSRAQVREAVDRSKSAYEDCYHDAAVRAGGGQAVKLAVTLDIDESGWARNVSVGTSQLSGLSACVKKTAQKLRSRFTPDIGSVRVTFQLAFQPTSK